MNGCLLLPRGSDKIALFPYDNENFICVLNQIGKFLYDEDLADYFEPAENKAVFFRTATRTVHALSGQFKTIFAEDYLIENEYVCQVFLMPLGGYVRFNLAYGFD